MTPFERRALRSRIGLELAGSIQLHGVDAIAEALALPVWRIRGWYTGRWRITDGWAQWLERRLAALPRACRVRVPAMAAPCFLDFRRALIDAQLAGDAELMAELSAEICELRDGRPK